MGVISSDFTPEDPLPRATRHIDVWTVICVVVIVLFLAIPAIMWLLVLFGFLPLNYCAV